MTIDYIIYDSPKNNNNNNKSSLKNIQSTKKTIIVASKSLSNLNKETQ